MTTRQQASTDQPDNYHHPITRPSMPPIPLPSGDWIAFELVDPESIEEDGRTGYQVNTELIKRAIELTTTDQASVLLLYDADQMTRRQVVELTYSLAGRTKSGTDKRISSLSWQQAEWINRGAPTA